MPARVNLLGRPKVDAGTGEGAGRVDARPRGRKSWAVLARVVLAERPMLRRELAEELFEQAEDPLAALRWSLADLRRALGLPEGLRGDPLHLDRSQLWIDVWALEDGALSPEEIRGELLDGAAPTDAPAFDAWLTLARSHCAGRAREGAREAALHRLADGDTNGAVRAAEFGARLDPLDETAQELLLRALVVAGRLGTAARHLTACEKSFRRAGLPVSSALRAAAVHRPVRPPAGVRAGAAASALLRAGCAALDAGAADAGVLTLRRAADDAGRAHDAVLEAEVLRALGSALVHAVRGSDGEGALVLHQALRIARTANRPALVAEVLRELAFVDVQAGRHGSAGRALDDARAQLGSAQDDALHARLLAVQGMNEADRGHHLFAVELLTRSAEVAARAGQERQRIWSLGVLGRSLLLLERVAEARSAAEASIAGAEAQRWHAFLPWPRALHAECAARIGDWATATREAEEAFALSCELGDPCWEGMTARAMALISMHNGDSDGAWAWTLDARTRCDRVPDRYVWISGYIALAQLEIARVSATADVFVLANRLHDDALRTDLPEFQAWALVHLAGRGDAQVLNRARLAARGVDSPALLRKLQPLRTQNQSGAAG